MRQRILAKKLFPVAFAILTGGCSNTPRHSNTLIFGTDTKFALDVSQDTTGGVGVTLGYKRHEAVWMPLMANVDSNGTLIPATCAEDECRKFQGTTGSAVTAAGADAVDTYSVLATFSGSASGGGGGAVSSGSPGAKANGTLAQYFATGIAARLLAQTGGASIVNTAGESKVTVIDSQTLKDAKAIDDRTNIAVERVMSTITDKSGNLDTAKYATLVSKAKPGNSNASGALLNLKTAEEIRRFLNSNFDIYGKPLFDALD